MFGAAAASSAGPVPRFGGGPCGGRTAGVAEGWRGAERGPVGWWGVTGVSSEGVWRGRSGGRRGVRWGVRGGVGGLVVGRKKCVRWGGGGRLRGCRGGRSPLRARGAGPGVSGGRAVPALRRVRPDTLRVQGRRYVLYRHLHRCCGQRRRWRGLPHVGLLAPIRTCRARSPMFVLTVTDDIGDRLRRYRSSTRLPRCVRRCRPARRARRRRRRVRGPAALRVAGRPRRGASGGAAAKAHSVTGDMDRFSAAAAPAASFAGVRGRRAAAGAPARRAPPGAAPRRPRPRLYRPRLHRPRRRLRSRFAVPWAPRRGRAVSLVVCGRWRGVSRPPPPPPQGGGFRAPAPRVSR